MNLGKNIMMIVSLMVAVIIALAVLVPVIQDTSASEDTLKNDKDAIGYFDTFTANDEFELVWYPTDPTKLKLNGESFTMPTPPPSGSYTCVTIPGQFLIRTDGATYIQEVGSLGGNIRWLFNTQSEVDDVTLTISSGTVTVVGGESTYSYTMAEGDVLYCVTNEKTDYVMKSPTQKAYLNSDSPILAMGLTTLDSVYYNGFYIGGTLENYNVIQYYPTSNTYTVSNVADDSTAVSGYNDLFTLEKITFTATNIATSAATDNVTYSYFIVPTEVTAERSAHVSPIEASLLGIIPLLVVIGIVIGAVWFIRQKN